MSISNITRTNTVDEWRIQTNLAAAELNQLESGDYDKISGNFNVKDTANVVITSTGTALQVTNTALFSTEVIVGKELSLGSQSTATGNLGVGGITSIYGPGTGLYVANNVISNGSLVVKDSIITANVTVNSNVVVVGTANVGYLGVGNTGVFGKSLTVGTSATVGTTLDVTGTATAGNLITSNVVQSSTLLVSGLGQLQNIVVTANTLTGNVTANNTVVANDARITENLTASHVTANVVGDNLRISSNATFGETTATTINATNARISGNANAAHVTITGSFVGDSLRIASNATFTETTATTINATNARISGNANTLNILVTDTANVWNLKVNTDATIEGTVVATGNGRFGNVNTSNVVSAGSFRTTGRGDFGAVTATSIETTAGTGDVTVGGKLTVSGDFVLSGDIVYDTDIFTISTITPITTTGGGYIGVFRGNDKGGVSGGSGGANANANAYIRWSASANNWQIRDVFNTDSSTNYSKILTANLISDSTSTSSSSLIASSKAVKDVSDASVKLNPGAVTQTISSGNIEIRGYTKSNGFISVLQTISPSLTTNLDLATYDNFIITLDKNITFTVSNLATKIGSSGIIVLKQNGTGGYTFTKASEMKSPLGGATIAQQTGAGTTSIISYFVVDASTMLISYLGNFA